VSGGVRLQGKQYILTPRLNETICRMADAEASSSQATRASPVPKQYGALPSLDGFHFHKYVMVKGQPAEEWKYKHQVC
jgi:hypothetical protein